MSYMTMTKLGCSRKLQSIIKDVIDRMEKDFEKAIMIDADYGSFLRHNFPKVMNTVRKYADPVYDLGHDKKTLDHYIAIGVVFYFNEKWNDPFIRERVLVNKELAKRKTAKCSLNKSIEELM